MILALLGVFVVLLTIPGSISSVNAESIVVPGLTMRLFNTSDCSVQNGVGPMYSLLNRYNLTNYYPSSASGDCTYYNPYFGRNGFFWIDASCTSTSMYFRGWTNAWGLNTTCPSLTSNSTFETHTIKSSRASEADSCTAATIQFYDSVFPVYAQWECVDVTVNNNTSPNSATKSVVVSGYVFIAIISTLIVHELMC